MKAITMNYKPNNLILALALMLQATLMPMNYSLYQDSGILNLDHQNDFDDLDLCSRDFYNQWTDSSDQPIEEINDEIHPATSRDIIEAEQNPLKCPCQDCPAVLQNEDSLLNHIITHIYKTRHTCSVANCYQVFPHKIKLIRHLINCHPNDNPYKNLLVPAQLNSQETGSVGNPSSKASRTASRPVPVNSEKPFKCTYPDCQKAYSHKKSLETHIHKHTGQKPFKCPYPNCQFATTSKGRLHHHIRGPHRSFFECPYPDCLFAFSYKRALTEHKRIHAEKSHVCPDCNTAFTFKNNLTRHIDSDTCKKRSTQVTRKKQKDSTEPNQQSHQKRKKQPSARVSKPSIALLTQALNNHKTSDDHSHEIDDLSTGLKPNFLKKFIDKPLSKKGLKFLFNNIHDKNDNEESSNEDSIDLDNEIDEILKDLDEEAFGEEDVFKPSKEKAITSQDISIEEPRDKTPITNSSYKLRSRTINTPARTNQPDGDDACLDTDSTHDQSWQEESQENSYDAYDVDEETKPVVKEKKKRKPVHIKKEDDGSYICSDCNQAFTQKGNLTTHIKNTHNGEKTYNHKCPTCDRAFTLKSNLKSHMLTHTPQKPFICDAPGCGKAYTKKSHLKDHMRTHTDDKPYKCEVEGCGKSFAKKEYLTAHNRVHTGERPHKCSSCGHAFAKKGNLITHMRIHNNEKPHKCTIDGCNKAFAHKSHLTEHQYTHTDERRFKCKVPGCDKAYTHGSNLKKHMCTHTNEEL